MPQNCKMIRSEKKLQNLSMLLQKKNSLLLKEAVQTLRDEPPFEGAIGLLASLYDRNDDISVLRAIEDFMNDMKDQSAIEEVMVEIRKEWKQKTLTMLISSCWQSGLDYSEYLPDLANIFVRCDYATAFECLTVIGESAENMSAERKSEISDILKTGEITDDKKSMFSELEKIIGV